MPPSALDPSTGAGDAAPELHLGPLARALEPRAALAGRLPAAVDGEDVRLLCAAQVLPEALRTALLAEGLLGERPSPDLARVEGPRSRLAALGTEHEGARVLLAAWDAARRPPARPRLMGILNVTPDSFSDGGRYRSPAEAVEAGLKLAAEGAEILDVGGESTRPGAPPVPLEEERERVLPVVEALARETDVVVGVDTRKAALAGDALDAGARLVNDVSAGRDDPEMLPLVARRGCDLVLMHMRGTPRDMQDAPTYADVTREVVAHLRERAWAAWSAGVALPRIAVDPGIGFGKGLQHNLELLRALPELRSLGRPVVCGLSRKSFLGTLGGRDRARDRDAETLAATGLAAALGADVHRVHDVETARRAAAVGHALGGGGSEPREVSR